MSIFILL